LCGLWEGSLTTVVGFRVALDLVNNGTCSESFVGNLVMIGNVGLHIQEELDKLRASERSINLEQSQRKDRKKLTVF